MSLYFIIYSEKYFEIKNNSLLNLVPQLICSELEIVRSEYNADVIKWKHFLLYMPFVRGIGQSLVSFDVSLICAGTKGCANNRHAGDLRRHRAHYDVTVMISICYEPRTHFSNNFAITIQTNMLEILYILIQIILKQSL